MVSGLMHVRLCWVKAFKSDGNVRPHEVSNHLYFSGLKSSKHSKSFVGAYVNGDIMKAEYNLGHT